MILTLHLTDLHYTQLNLTTWCATAQVSESSCLRFEALRQKASWLLIAYTPYLYGNGFRECNWHYYAAPPTLSVRTTAQNQRQLQRKGVRLLLKRLLDNLGIIDFLDESAFPYRLKNSGHYVCFSHTSTKSSIEISIKSNSVQEPSKTFSSHVAVIISQHRPVGIDIENNNVKWRVAQRFYSDNEMAVISTLPVIQRDSIAKLLWQIKESFIKIHQYTLAQGLGMDYAYLITDLMETIKESSFVFIINASQSDYSIAILPTQRTVVVF